MARQRRSPNTSFELPLRTLATNSLELHIEGVRGRYEKLLEHLQIDRLYGEPEITDAELRRIADRVDRAFAAASGVSTRDRLLAELHDAVDKVACSITGDFEKPEVNFALNQGLWMRFNLWMTHQYPNLKGGREEFIERTQETVVLTQVRSQNRAFVAAARAMRPGRLRKGAKAIPQKWEALRDLAAYERLIGTMQPREFRRTVLNAKAKLRALSEHLPKE